MRPPDATHAVGSSFRHLHGKLIVCRPVCLGSVKPWYTWRHFSCCTSGIVTLGRMAPTAACALVMTGHAVCRVGTAARPHLMVTHYTELEQTKGLVLVRGDVLSTSRRIGA